MKDYVEDLEFMNAANVQAARKFKALADDLTRQNLALHEEITYLREVMEGLPTDKMVAAYHARRRTSIVGVSHLSAEAIHAWRAFASALNPYKDNA